MALSLQKKEEIIYKIRETAKKSLSAVVASLDGITVNEVTKLRKEARDLKVYIHVVRNTLMRKVVKDTSLSCLQNILIGQNIVAFSIHQPRDSARVFVKFNKSHKHFKIKGAAFEGKFIPALKINLLSDLPNHEEAISRLMTIIKTSSIGNLIRVLYVLSNQKLKL
ncbi:50S ribosomal protein L10 [Candidatus Blochmannia vicinus]|uniref:Large ribosomal subunit protein uL10 n=1 Tax=Candidatus Blochmannia vicinus (nom. nud.) TaxID=251540 RepID=A0A9Q8U041_9ENTR|nr:50S ribosomal protein L10 [Candidatus Blochmannia vicinus]URJ28225.1 50S ribosomal protein L10 [Candidatus Blochmannia vicinus]URJ30499.1 50S ribosomal protein L10 [Candidatus Blochmannia vicinus]URJ33202.1 50S ribosomal protein L10 [Candidatus Blochmannia vicinus]